MTLHGGFRHAAVDEVIERLVPPGDEPYEQRAARVLSGIIREHRLEKDTGYLAVSGAQVFVHVLEFGFKLARKPDLEKAVGAELEGIVPVDLEELVYACEALPPIGAPAPPAVPGAEVPPEAAAAPLRGRAAPPTEGMRVLTYAMRMSRARELLEITAGAGNEARGLVPVAALARLTERLPGLAGPTPVAIVDVGHEHTDVVVAIGGRAVYSRTFTRGGRHVTEAISKNWRLPFADAEHAKHTDGFLASSVQPATSEAWKRVHDVLVTEVGPWVRELRQTLAACRAKTGAAAGRVLLVGGGSRLRGLADFTGEQLGLPTSTLGPDAAAALLGPSVKAAGAAPTAADGAALALAIAFDLSSGKPTYDLRQGPLAFKVDMSFITTKLTQVAIAGLVVLLFAGAAAWVGLRQLHKDDKLLTERVAVESTEYKGKPMTVKEILAEQGPTGGAEESPLPKMSAFDILLEINSKLPPRDKITIDITELEIRDTQVSIKAAAKKPEEIDQFETAMRDVKCLKDGARSNTQTAGDWINFSYTFKNECM
ncbi:MAG TPA: pilus assembly protein PilM [Kofleriaceae bacterium]|nr:pilus assembly protein PilM [Kofleriaceae bacterium]